MRLTAISCAVIALTAGAAFAQNFTEIDSDGDGKLTIEEVRQLYPNVKQEGFDMVDTNGDGAVDEAEYDAAQEDGVIKHFESKDR